MKFDDIEFPFRDDVFSVKASEVTKLYRSVSCLVKLEYMADVNNVLADKPWLFSDAYFKALTFGTCSDAEDFDADDVLFWMQSNDENKVIVLDKLMFIKRLFNAPEKIASKLKSTTTTKKKKVVTKKK